MELRQLRYFKAVVKSGSFSTAAKTLGRTQQAVSKSVSNLEDVIGVPILERGNKAIIPTSVGKLLLQHAETIERQLESFSEQLSLIKRSSEGRVKIGVGAVGAQTLLPQAVARLHTSHPKLMLDVFSGVMSGMIPNLMTGDIDLIIAVETEELANQQVDRIPLGYECFCIVVGAEHPVRKERKLCINKLLKFPWIIGRNLEELVSTVEKTFYIDGIGMPENVTYTTSSEFAVNVLKTMHAVAILPRQMVQQSVDAGELAIIGEEEYSWLRPLIMVVKKQDNKPASLIAVIDSIQEVCKSAAMRKLLST